MAERASHIPTGSPRRILSLISSKNGSAEQGADGQSAFSGVSVFLGIIKSFPSVEFSRRRMPSLERSAETGIRTFYTSSFPYGMAQGDPSCDTICRSHRRLFPILSMIRSLPATLLRQQEHGQWDAEQVASCNPPERLSYNRSFSWAGA